MAGSKESEDQGGETRQFWNFKDFLEKHGKHPMAYIQDLEGFKEAYEKLLLLMAKMGDEMTHQRNITPWFDDEKKRAAEKVKEGMAPLDATMALYDRVIRAARDDFTKRSDEIAKARERDKEAMARLVLTQLKSPYECYKLIGSVQLGEFESRIGSIFNEVAVVEHLKKEAVGRKSVLGGIFKKKPEGTTELTVKGIGQEILRIAEQISQPDYVLSEPVMNAALGNNARISAFSRGSINELGAIIQGIASKYRMLRNALNYAESEPGPVERMNPDFKEPAFIYDPDDLALHNAMPHSQLTEESLLVRTLQRERESYDARIAGYTRQLREIKQAKEDLEQSNDSLDQRCKQLEALNQQLDADIKTVQGELQSAEQERDRLQIVYKNADTKAKEGDQYRMRVTDYVREREEQKQRHERQLAEKAREIAALQDNLRVTKAGEDGYHEMAKQLQRQVEEANHELAGANVNNEHLKSELAGYKRHEDQEAQARAELEKKYREELQKRDDEFNLAKTGMRDISRRLGDWKDGKEREYAKLISDAKVARGLLEKKLQESAGLQQECDYWRNRFMEARDALAKYEPPEGHESSPPAR